MMTMDFTDDRSSSASGGPAPARADHRNQGNVLFVGNLPFHTPWQSIKDQFRRAGKVRYTDLIADRSGRPKGSALVTMHNAEGARRAIQFFNEVEFEGRRLIVRLFDDGPRPPLVSRELLPSYTRRGAGSGAPSQQQQQQHPQRARGAKPSKSCSAHQAQPIFVDDQMPPRPRSVHEADRKLFISNLPFDCTANALRETFQQVGNVERAEIIVVRN